VSLYYEDEYVQLHHGDCRAIRGWTTADVLVTDPPYGVTWTGAATYSGGKRRGTGLDAIAGDAATDVRDEVLSLWGERPAIVFGSWKAPRPDGVKQRLIWHKAANLPGVTSHPWFPNDEEIYVLGRGFVGKPTPTVYTTHDKRDGAHGEVAKLGHPTPKPVGLMERLIEKCPEGVIADPFAGSGATLIAARNLGRKAIGVEVEEKYCELIVRRLSQQAFDFSSLEAS
jgi:site-specific DNA-methyltransferase (adenine-specific)